MQVLKHQHFSSTEALEAVILVYIYSTPSFLISCFPSPNREMERLEVDFLYPLAEVLSAEMRGRNPPPKKKQTKNPTTTFEFIIGAFARRWQCN